MTSNGTHDRERLSEAETEAGLRWPKRLVPGPGKQTPAFDRTVSRCPATAASMAFCSIRGTTDTVGAGRWLVQRRRMVPV